MAETVLVTLADENYLEQAKQLFSSAYWHGGWNGDFLLLVHGVAPEKLRWFENKGIYIYKCAPLANRPIGIEGYPPIVLDKFYVFGEYFKKWKRVVFLDGDIIVRSSLAESAAAQSFSAPEAMLLDLEGEFLNTDKKLWLRLNKKYKLAGKAFNSGVFCFPTSLIDKDTFNDLLQLFREYEPLSRFGEEAALNLFFQGRWHRLAQTYNINPGLLTNFLFIRTKNVRGAILHFVASIKPWKLRSRFRKEWLDNFKRAENMDLHQRPVGAAAWEQKDTDEYEALLAKRMRWLHLYYVAAKPMYFIDKQIGRLGLSIKKRWPMLYEKISLNK
jgi:lipopolysaccharide biosynthesis glycosyltransferase